MAYFVLLLIHSLNSALGNVHADLVIIVVSFSS